MTAIRAKLNSRRGASLLLALLVFLVCAMAGAGALTAASANVGRYQYAEEEEQAYLAVSSAARMVEDGLLNHKHEVTFTIRTTITYTLIKDEYGNEIMQESSKIYKCINEKFEFNSALESFLKEDLDDLFKVQYLKQYFSGTSRPVERTVTFKMDDLPDVTAQFNWDDTGSFHGTFWVAQGEKQLYKTVLDVAAPGWEEKLHVGSTRVESSEFILVTDDIYTYELTWSGASYTRPEGGSST